MKVSTKARYAVMAMVDLATHGKDHPVSLPEIALRQELPLPYLEQLFNKLKKTSLVKSSRGSAGGYLLNHPAQEIRILDVIHAVDRPVKTTRCENHSPKGCQNSGMRCLTHDLWEELGAVIHLFLAKVTLADICDRRVLGLGRFSFQAFEEARK
ncbi:Rrf2 family transcriptional regulator [Candidatus Paracaedibacter symbiosus]|uniref:Rrf2 family transcriptional regulator n=1 Tax=Candidatus Paracaedibacter symbiosus TaxID=244582 RepID=UPI00050976FC|nr:Rrf2 family transcriptional regulator [Candidatus Paracaedibacter symbiosus]